MPVATGSDIRLSVVIPTRDRCDELAATLAELVDQVGCDDEIIVIDNGSADQAPARLASRFDQVRWIELGANMGCAARNVGAAAAGGDVVVMMDDDSIPVPGTLDGLREAFADDADLAAIACRIRLADDPERHDAGGLAGVIVNCGAAIRRAAFLDVGGYPIDFDYYAEEYDLCCRLWRAGWRIAPRGDLVFLHRRSPRNRDANRMLARLVRNNLTVWSRYAPESMRQRMMIETVDRYQMVARREDADAGFREGLARWQAEAVRRPPARTPLTEAQLDTMFGLPIVRRSLARERDAWRGRRFGVWTRGKGCPQLLDALRAAGADVAGVYEPNPAARTWLGWPLRDATSLHNDEVSVLVPGTLSPGAAEDLGRELAGRFADLQILSAIGWSSSLCATATAA
jgi:GT2 family glycosyltransferase